MKTKLQPGEHRGIYHDFETGKTFECTFNVIEGTKEEREKGPVLDLKNPNNPRSVR